jgi:Fe-S-cluster containining protein
MKSYTSPFMMADVKFIKWILRVSPTTDHYYKQIMTTLDQQVAELQTEFKHHLNCKKGCSSCCENVHFKISYIEALELLKGFKSLTQPQKEQVLINLESASPHCPFLVEGSCSAYQYRPTLCRAFGLLIQVGQDIGTCGLNFNDSPKPGESLKKLDIAPYYSLLEELSASLWKSHNVNSPKTTTAPRLSIREFLQLLLKT